MLGDTPTSSWPTRDNLGYFLILWRETAICLIEAIAQKHLCASQTATLQKRGAEKPEAACGEVWSPEAV